MYDFPADVKRGLTPLSDEASPAICSGTPNRVYPGFGDSCAIEGSGRPLSMRQSLYGLYRVHFAGIDGGITSQTLRQLPSISYRLYHNDSSACRHTEEGCTEAHRPLAINGE